MPPGPSEYHSVLWMMIADRGQRQVAEILARAEGEISRMLPMHPEWKKFNEAQLQWLFEGITWGKLYPEGKLHFPGGYKPPQPGAELISHKDKRHVRFATPYDPGQASGRDIQQRIRPPLATDGTLRGLIATAGYSAQQPVVLDTIRDACTLCKRRL